MTDADCFKAVRKLARANAKLLRQQRVLEADLIDAQLTILKQQAQLEAAAIANAGAKDAAAREDTVSQTSKKPKRKAKEAAREREAERRRVALATAEAAGAPILIDHAVRVGDQQLAKAERKRLLFLMKQ